MQGGGTTTFKVITILKAALTNFKITEHINPITQLSDAGYKCSS